MLSEKAKIKMQRKNNSKAIKKILKSIECFQFVIENFGNDDDLMILENLKRKYFELLENDNDYEKELKK